MKLFLIRKLACLLPVCLVWLFWCKQRLAVLRSTEDNIPMWGQWGQCSHHEGCWLWFQTVWLPYVVPCLPKWWIFLSDELLGQEYVVGLVQWLLRSYTRLDHWRSLVSIGIDCYCYRLIILNIYEIPNLDQKLRLFNAILLALVYLQKLQKS